MVCFSVGVMLTLAHSKTGKSTLPALVAAVDIEVPSYYNVQKWSR